MIHVFDDTIVALATANSPAALSIIRVSGTKAITIVNNIFKGKNLENVASHTIHYGYIVDLDLVVDEVMVSVFKAPKSFTTEDLVEISCHGSPYLSNQIISLLISKGCRQAAPGEFTLRAYLNGRLDLIQAEAVADLIASQNKASQQIALTHLKSGFSNDLKLLREQLIHITALLELELDFGEEDVTFADRNQLKSLLDAIYHKIIQLLNSFEKGNAIKHGIPTAIVGKPNVGKSTLLNALLNDERAIVSNIAGTTRDTIEEVLNIDHLQFRLIDTAGIRQSVDVVENLGIKKSFEKIKSAHLVLLLIDATVFDENAFSIEEFIEENSLSQVIIVINKIDKINALQLNAIEEYMRKNKLTYICLSAENKLGIDNLKNKMVDLFREVMNFNDAVMVTNHRHFNELQQIKIALDKVYENFKHEVSTDILALDIKLAIYHLGSITGQIEMDRDILGTIFSKFCIGK